MTSRKEKRSYVEVVTPICFVGKVSIYVEVGEVVFKCRQK